MYQFLLSKSTLLLAYICLRVCKELLSRLGVPYLDVAILERRVLVYVIPFSLLLPALKKNYQAGSEYFL